MFLQLNRVRILDFLSEILERLAYSSFLCALSPAGEQVDLRDGRALKINKVGSELNRLPLR